MQQEKNKIIIYFPDTAGYNFTPPYELLIQAEALKEIDAEIILADNRTVNFDTVFSKYALQTKCVIISTIIKYTSISIIKQIQDGFLTAEKVKNRSDVPVIWTGLASTVVAAHILEDKNSDFLIRGTGEKALLQFLNAYFKNEKYTHIPNLWYKKNNNPFINNYEYHNAWDPWGNFNPEVINMENYINSNSLDYIASTGCINDCTYCTVPVIYKRKWKHNSIENITSHLRYFFTHFPSLNHIHFRDDNFLVNKSFIFKLFENLHKHDLSFSWSTQASINVVSNYSDDELNRLRAYGFNNISVGIESGDEFILEKTTKYKTTPGKSLEIIHKLLKAKITVSVTSIISFPYNNGRDYIKTLRLLMKIKLFYPNLNIYCTIFHPIPGTKLFKDIYRDSHSETGIYGRNTWTSDKRKIKLKKFETFYFLFDNKHFYKNLSPEISRKIKWINLLFYPFIKLRFRLGITSFLWEYALIAKSLNKVKSKWGIHEDKEISQFGIRHHNMKYNYGFRRIKK
jgi:radical SAM superfamily enzyme YgiQ (UPF0313 family)